MSRPYRTETGLARDVAEWLADQGFDVYHEVAPWGAGAPRADVVAVSGRLVWVIECKLSLSLQVIAQAERWTHWANAVSVAVPSARPSGARTLAAQVLRDRGIGLLSCSPLDEGSAFDRVRWGKVAPQLQRRACTGRLRESLTPKQRRYAPGNAANKFHTPFRDTCDRLRRLVKRDPGVTMKDTVRRIEHHYSSDAVARAHLADYIRRGVLKGVRIESGRPLRLFPAA